MTKLVSLLRNFSMALVVIAMVVAGPALYSCQALKSIDANAICNNALVQQLVVIAAAQVRGIPVQQYVDALCKISDIVEPFLVAPLKPDVLGAEGNADPVQQSLEAARKRGLVK
jgi:hypothetical protein